MSRKTSKALFLSHGVVLKPRATGSALAKNPEEAMGSATGLMLRAPAARAH